MTALSASGSTSTFSHTQYQGAQPPPPHEIVIDLGARHSLTSFQYTPRQDGNRNVAAAAGRYIRFRALSEVNGKAYTRVAELNVAGTPSP